MEFFAKLAEMFENIFAKTLDKDVSMIFEEIKKFFLSLSGAGE